MLLIASGRRTTPPPPRPASPVPPRHAAAAVPSGLTVLATPHYRVRSAADARTTAEVAAAVEALHAAYGHVFPVRAQRPMDLVLYRDRAQFKAFNRSASWAEKFLRIVLRAT